MNANEIKQLLEQEDIYNKSGKITMSLSGIGVTIKQNDIIGNALQEWLGEFLTMHNIYYRPNKGQTFPDFYFEKSDINGICEMKSFLSAASPAFDVANFNGYIDSLRTNAYRLDCDYLIFSYKNDSEGNISICEIWCKKVWEITGPSKDYDLKCQRKKGEIVNIRPANWRTDKGQQPFNSLEKFIVALYKTYLGKINQTRLAKGWLDEVLYNYLFHTGKDIREEVNRILAIS